MEDEKSFSDTECYFGISNMIDFGESLAKLESYYKELERVLGYEKFREFEEHVKDVYRNVSTAVEDFCIDISKIVKGKR